jgi:hypothetical protein
MISLVLMLASAHPMPSIDRRWLNEQAQIEATRPQTASLKPRGPATARELLVSDVEAITTICIAAASAPSPAAFVTRIGTAFEMPGHEVASLRSKCAFYIAGGRDASQFRAGR